MKELQNFSKYLIFKNGDIFTKARTVNSRYKTRKRKGFILKHNKGKTEYPFVVLFDDNGKRNTKSIHRLLAMAFIPNPDNKPNVHHKNHNRFDFRLDNLEWVTHRENIMYAVDDGRMTGHLNRAGKRVLQYSKEGEFIKEWKSTMDIQRKLGLFNTNISLVCRGKRATCGGFIFKYK